jgi:hypothetical protein
MSESKLEVSKLRDEGVKELYITLSEKHPTITIRECYELYDIVVKINEKK